MAVDYTLWICGSFFLLLFAVVLLPISIYFTWEFYECRSHPAIFGRQFDLSFAYQVSNVVYLMVHISVLSFLLIVTGGDLVNADKFEWLWAVVRGLMPILLLALALRIWIVYMDTNHSICAVNGVWIQHIQPNQDMSTNFFIKYYGNLGNSNWMLKYIFLPLTILFLMMAFAPAKIVIGPGIFGCIVLEIIFATAVRFNTPKVKDLWRIKDEFKYALRWTLVLVVVCIVGLTIAFSKSLRESSSKHVHRVVTWPLLCVTFFGMSLCTNYWVLRRSGLLDGKEYRENMAATNGSKGDSSKDGSGVGVAVASKEKEKDKAIVAANSQADMNMIKLLGSTNGFYAFMSHCISEYSPEGLLFLLEAYQFVKAFGDPERKIDFLELPDDLPKSDIVYGSTSSSAETSVQNRFLALVGKYFPRGAPLELNLPHRTRRDILQLCDDIQTKGVEPDALCRALEKPMRNTMTVFYDNYERFVKTAEFRGLTL